jgi:Rad3-related DNA helicase
MNDDEITNIDDISKGGEFKAEFKRKKNLNVHSLVNSISDEEINEELSLGNLSDDSETIKNIMRSIEQAASSSSQRKANIDNFLSVTSSLSSQSQEYLYKWFQERFRDGNFNFTLMIINRVICQNNFHLFQGGLQFAE